MAIKYIKIDNNKVPLNSLDKTYTYSEIENDPAVAILVPDGYVVLDLDNDDHFRCLCNIIETKNIKCKIMKTDRGGHFWFKTADKIPNFINVNTPITLKVDVKCGGKKSLVTIKKNGKWRKWLRQDEIVDEIPFWLIPLKYDKDLYDMAEGDGRDSQLFSYIIPLIKKGFTKEQIYEIFNIINKYIFATPLKQAEIDKMFEKNEIFEDKKMSFFKGREFQHHLFADYIIENYNIKGYGHLPYIYLNNVYTFNPDKINSLMIRIIPNLKRAQIAEVFENIRLKCNDKNESINPFMVNVKNGIIDLKTFEILDHDPNIFTVNQLNCIYNENAYDMNVDKMLNNLTCNNSNLRKLIEEMLGYFLLGDCRYQKAFILLGQGSNGKSAFLKLIENWLGKNNISELSLSQLNEKFKTAELVGKIANIGDDIDKSMLKDTSVFKKLVTGDGVTVERKNKDAFNFSNIAKMVFSANALPPSSDKSNGFFRRIVIIPFNAVFNSKNPDFDPNIEDKINTENARSYLLNLALQGINRLQKNKGFIIPEEVRTVVNTYEIDNNNVLQWIESKATEIENKTINEVYTDYCLFCSQNNQIAVQIRNFNNEVRKRFSDLEIVNKNNKNYWTKKEEN